MITEDNYNEFSFHSRMMEVASDIADKRTEKECKENNIKCTVETRDGLGEGTVISFTEEAQDIYNVHYGELNDTLLNSIIPISAIMEAEGKSKDTIDRTMEMLMGVIGQNIK